MQVRKHRVGSQLLLWDVEVNGEGRSEDSSEAGDFSWVPSLGLTTYF
jgi:hypothetical protein